MDYPATLPLETLLHERGEYRQRRSHLKAIHLLTQGGYELKDKLAEFIPQKPDEIDEVYEARLGKFTYRNVFGDAIARLASKFSVADVFVSEKEDPFWQQFRLDNNGRGRTEKALLSQLFIEAVAYGGVWVHVDKPASDIEIINLQQEQQLGLTPRLIVYPVMQVPLWGYDDNGLAWAKVYQLTEEAAPFGEPVTRATWTFIDREKVAKYSTLVSIRGDKVEIAEDDEVALQSEVAHGFGRIPLIRVDTPNHLWGGNHAYPIAEEYLRLLCHEYDFLTSAYLQRTYKPFVLPDSLDQTFTDAEDATPPTGMEYVSEVESFTWNEPRGDILEKLSQALKESRAAIRAVLSVGGHAYTDEVSEASGASKEMDYVDENDRLKAYGALFTDALQQIYRLVAVSVRKNEDIAVSGLSEFGHRTTEDTIATLIELLKIDWGQLSTLLTPTLFLLVRERVLGALIGNLNPEQKDAIKSELAATTEPSG